MCLKVCKVLFSLFFATCFVPVFMCLVCFGSTAVLFYFVRPAFNVCSFPCGLCGPFCSFVCCLPCFERFALFVGFAGYIWFGMLSRPAFSVCPFSRGLREPFCNFVCCLPCF